MLDAVTKEFFYLLCVIRCDLDAFGIYSNILRKEIAINQLELFLAIHCGMANGNSMFFAPSIFGAHEACLVRIRSCSAHRAFFSSAV